MAETGAIRAGRAFVELFLKDSLLIKGLAKVQARLRAMGAALIDIGKKTAAIGAVALAPLIASLRIFAKEGDALAKMSQRTGASVEALSELGYAADQSGASIDSLERGLRIMQRTIVEAATGSQGAQDALARLGLTVQDLAGLAPDDQFTLIADRLSKIEDPAIKAATAMELFGRGGTELLPMLADGAAGIAQLREEARRFGLTTSTQAANDAVYFGDQVAIVGKQAKKVAFEIGAALAPALIDFVHKLQHTLKATIDWVKANRETIVTVAKVLALVTATGIAMITLGLAVKVLAFALTPLVVALKLVAAAFAIIQAVVLAILTPFALIVATIVGLGALFLTQSKAGQTAMKDLGGSVTDLSKTFKTLGSDAGEALDGIKTALASGDFAAAARVGWAFLKLEWVRGINFLSIQWEAFRQGFLEAWADTVHMFATLFVGGVGLIRKLFVELEAGWHTLLNRLGAFFDNWGTGIAKGWEEIKEMVGATTPQERNRNIQDLDGGLRQRGESRDQSLIAIERDREASQRRVNQEIRGTFESMNRERAEAERKRIDSMNKSINDAAEELKAAQQAFAGAIAEVRQTAADRAAKLRDSAKDARKDLYGPPTSDSLFRQSAQGTFNGLATQALQGGVWTKMLEEMRKQSLIQNRMMNALEHQNGNGGVAFE